MRFDAHALNFDVVGEFGVVFGADFGEEFGVEVFGVDEEAVHVEDDVGYGG